jgi:hypothetical protein
MDRPRFTLSNRDRTRLYKTSNITNILFRISFLSFRSEQTSEALIMSGHENDNIPALEAAEEAEVPKKSQKPKEPPVTFREFNVSQKISFQLISFHILFTSPFSTVPCIFKEIILFSDTKVDSKK